MEVLGFEKLQKARFERLRSTLHAYIDQKPNADMARGILELALYKRRHLNEKIKYLEKEVALKGLKLENLAIQNADHINKILHLH